MATHFASRQGCTRAGLGALACALGWLLSLSAAAAQDFSAQPPRARQLLKSAREQYAKGEYEVADQLYQQVALSKEGLTAAEQKDLAAQMQQNSTALQARQDGARLLLQTHEALQTGKTAEAENFLRLAQTNQFLSPTDKQQAAHLAQGLSQLRVTQAQVEAKGDARTLVARGREALKIGDLNTAEMLARQAEKKTSFLTPLQFWNDSPSRLLDDVRAARARAPQTNGADSVAMPSAGDAPKAVVSNYSHVDDADRAKVKAQARQLVLDGYKALGRNDVATARTLANQARDLKPDLEWWDTNPDKPFTDIGRHAAATQAAPVSGDPRVLLRQARGLFLQQRYDEAEKLAAQAETIPGSRWGLFEDSPRKLRDEIGRARSQLDQDRASKLTVEARNALKRGSMAEAKTLASQAKQLQGQASSLWSWSDTPDAILRDALRLEKTNPQPAVAANPNVPMAPPDIAAVTGKPSGVTPAGQIEPVPPPASFVSAQAQMQTKNRALALLAEARTLERQGHLTEARTKTIEAEKTHAQWSPYEESPGAVLRDLDTKAGARIRQLLDQAGAVVLNNPTDPARFQRADAYLLTARRLAESFRQDTAPIDHKVHWLQQVAARNSQSRNEVASNATLQSAQLPERLGAEEASEPTGRGGSDKLNQARLELGAGNTLLARKLAEDAYFDPDTRKEAGDVLRSIDAEEHGQTMVTAQRNYTAGMDAFAQRDFAKAANLLRTIDVRLLKADQARRVAEVMEAPNMQAAVPLKSGKITPVAVADAGRDSIGKATVSDLEDPQLAAVQQMQQIQFDKFRGLKLSAEQRAADLAKAGEEEKAIETLADYLAQLGASGMDKSGRDRLSTAVEDRIQKLRAEMARKEIERDRQAAITPKHDEGAYLAKKTKTQEKVAEFIARGNQKMKEGKYDEALAEAIKAHDLDPDNAAARALQYVATMKQRSETYVKNQSKMEKHFIDMLDNDPGDIVTNRDPVAVNREHFSKINGRRDISVQAILSKTPRELAIERKLAQPITLNFRDQPFYRVLEDLQILSGVSIDFDRPALKDKGISVEQPLTLNVDNVSLKSALNLLLRQMRLTWTIRDEVIYITTPENTQGQRRIKTYSISDLVIPVENKSNEIHSFEEALKRHINKGTGAVQYQSPTPYAPSTAMGGGTPVSSGASGVGHGGATPTWTRHGTSNTIEHLLIGLITNTISPDTWEGTGGQGTIQYYPLGHALVIGQVQEVQEEVQALLNALRRLQDIQIAIEMRVVSVGEQFFERIGLDFDVNIRTPQYRAENQLLTGNYAPFGQVNRNLGVKDVVTGLTPAGTLTPDLNVPIRNSSFDFSIPAFGGYPGALGASGGLSLGLAFLSDIQVFMFLEAAQGDRRTHIMQAPKITVFNGQTANINVSDVMFFLTEVTVVQAGSQTFFVPQNNPFPIGVGMSVTPVVSADRRFVRVNLTPTLSNLISPNIPLIPVQIPVPQLFDAPNGQGAISGQPVIFQMFFQQPAFTTININTTVNVPDGGTVLLGGMKTLAEGRTEFGPPILSKIPYLSRLFRNTTWGRDAQSIMILVTPRIIINEEIEQEILGNIAPIPR